jgi:hypothetical protein
MNCFGSSGADVHTPEQFSDVNAAFRRLEEQSTELLKAYWPAIERVAKALLERPLLNQNDLNR